MQAYEQLGLFYLGKRYDLGARRRTDEPVLYDARDLVTHAVCVGMTGSGKTGLGVAVIEEAALDGIPVLAIDPKGDLANLLLTFPSLAPPDFVPWVQASEAATRGMTVEDFAVQQAETWKAGLAEWQQDSSRIERLRAAAEVKVYTPGSRAATPLALLKSLAPSAQSDDEEIAAARVGTTADSILALAGMNDAAAHSRERVLLAAILQHAWQNGTSVDLGALVQHVQKPPFDRVGVLDLETFYPARDRQELALKLNAALAAPGFDVWLSGDPLDVAQLLYTPEGKPRVAIISIAHLDEVQRMLVVALLLNEVVAWTRAQAGTTTLRALIYMDEVAGYFPPVANPPSKAPLMTLLKQARAFGVGVMVCTQNPVDLDYKALSNAGTWFLGKLQTERDKARVLDGLEGAAAGSFDRSTLDTTLSALTSRVFLLHNVHEREPIVFETRWTLSYLRGPLTKEELRRVSGGAKPRAAAPATPAAATAATSTKPVIPAGVREFYFPGAASAWEPALYGSARVAYTDAKRGIDTTVDVNVITPFRTGAVVVDWSMGTDVDVAPDALASTTPPGARYVTPPVAALEARSYTGWERDFERWIAQARPLRLFTAKRLELSSRPGESERDFRVRVQQARRERRDADVERLRAQYAPRLQRLADRVAKAQDTVARERQQANQQKMQSAVSIGATMVGALLGRKVLSGSTLGRATTAARGVSRATKEAEDVGRAETKVTELQGEVAAMEAELQSEIAAMTSQGDEPLETVEIKPKRGAADVRLVSLVWIPSAS
jgi:hypothetical protein